jgi:anti-anti-sigma factor
VGHVAVVGPLDIDSVPEVDDALRRAASGSELVVVDLDEMTSIDSCGVEALVTADRRIREGGGRLIVVRGPAVVQWLLALARADSLPEGLDGSPAETPVPPRSLKGRAA